MEAPPAPLIDINPKLCVFCGVCEVLCPFGAIKIYINGKRSNPVLEKGCLSEVIREIKIDVETCRRVNLLCDRLCVAVCPLNLLYFNGFSVSISDVSKCPTCKWCENACRSVIHVRKIFSGVIEVYNEKCPVGCKNCVYQCPVGALYVDEDGKVYVLDDFCIYCGACVNVCPIDGAINIKITYVNTAALESRMWKIALEKLSKYNFIQNIGEQKGDLAQYALWPKVIKSNDERKLLIQRIVYTKSYTLVLDREVCKGCRICHLVCPKGAVIINKVSDHG
ncbi:MAG: 4Fe-4S binding protein [Candidatus Bathyarchaeia archaeon]